MNQTAAEVASMVSLILSESLESNADIFAFESYRAARHDVETYVKKHFRGVKVASGAYRTAFIFNDFVVKFARDEYRQDAILTEAEFINELRADKKYGRHFPETYVVQVGEAPVLLQQKVDMSHRDISWDDHDQVERLGTFLGIDDVHEGNYGWAGPKGKQYPVFVDVDLRRQNAGSRNPIRSWHI